MGVYDKLKVDLETLYKQRGVNRVVYFHCDHWEPWKLIPGQGSMSAKNVDDVARFVDTTNQIDFARKLTLFYKPNINHEVALPVLPEKYIKAHPDDGVHFTHKSITQADNCRQAMRYLAGHSSHELQVHIHHENFTYNHDHRSARSAAYFERPDSRTHEVERFALAVRLWLAAIQDESGRPIDRWFFVHGHWALNASDPKVCHIVNEIEIMMQHGCAGDFTFPAGRPDVNPRLEVPYFASVVNKPKGYDLQEAHPEFAYGNKRGADSKFFIWASDIKHNGASLDFYASWMRKRLDEMNEIAREIVSRSFLVDGTLFIKSHAHSMHPQYFDDCRIPVFPHQQPSIQNMFSVLFEAAGNAGASVEFMTASEVYDTFINADYMPAGGRELIIPGTPADLATVVPPPLPPGYVPHRLPKIHVPMGEAWEKPVPLPAAALPGSGPVTAAPGPVPAPAATVRPAAPPAQPAGPLSSKKIPRKNGELRVVSEIPLIDTVFINDIAVDVMRARIASMGEVESGASAYYATRVSQSLMLTRYETELADYLKSSPEKFETYYEIGCGAAPLTLVLAANGMPAAGIESDRRRIAIAEEILLALGERMAQEARRLRVGCKIIAGRFPSILASVDVSRSVALVTNVTPTMTPDERKAFIEGLLRFPVVIVDVQRFLKRLLTDAEQDAALAELLELGFSDPELIFHLGSNGRFFRLRGKPEDAALARPVQAAE